MKPTPPKPPLKAFFAQVQGKPGARWVFDPPRSVVGFYRLLGMTVRDENELVTLATAELAREDTVLVQVEEVWVA